MDLKSIGRRVAALAARVPRPRLHRGITVQFVDCENGKPKPLPADAPPHRQPEARDPRAGLDVIWLDADGSELSRCA